MKNELKYIVESLLMVAESPLTVARIQGLFDPDAVPGAGEIKSAIMELNQDFEDRSVEIKKVGPGYRLHTRVKYAPWIQKLQARRPPRLSRAQMETLAIIAYRQPVTRGDIEKIRGVSVSPDIMQRLFEREWVRKVGVREVPGRPELLGTTSEFLAYFNLESLRDLPPLMEQRDLGEIVRSLDTPLPGEVLSALESRVLEARSDTPGK